MWQKTKSFVIHKIIHPFAKSRLPASELAMASAVGLFWAFTPLVGLQMTLVLINWFLFRSLGVHFHLGIALAWVWLSNPITMPFIYFGFYLCGFFTLRIFDQEIAFISFRDFSKVLKDSNEIGFWDGALHWLSYIYDFLLWPMFLGSGIIAIPICLGAYVLSFYLLKHYRSGKAKAMGIHLQDWERRFVQRKSLEKE